MPSLASNSGCARNVDRRYYYYNRYSDFNSKSRCGFSIPIADRRLGRGAIIRSNSGGGSGSSKLSRFLPGSKQAFERIKVDGIEEVVVESCKLREWRSRSSPYPVTAINVRSSLLKARLSCSAT